MEFFSFQKILYRINMVVKINKINTDYKKLPLFQNDPTSQLPQKLMELEMLGFFLNKSVVSKVIYDIVCYLTPFWVILYLPHVFFLV